MTRPASLPSPPPAPSGDSARMPPGPPLSALAWFASLSEQLSDSYQAMAERVGQLDEALQGLADQRLRELQERERLAARLQSLLSLLPAGVVVLDGSGRISEANPAAEGLLGRPLVGRRWAEVIEQAFVPRGDDGHEISLRDGRRVSLATQPLEAEPGQLLLLTDLTRTRALQQRLARHQRLSEMGRMVSALAHQLRTPLAAAMLYAGQLAEAGTTALPPDQVQRFGERIVERLQHLENQVHDMLTFVSGDVRPGEVTTAAVLARRLEQALEGVLTRAGAQCSLWVDDPEARVLCHGDSVLGALGNLVDNALQAAGSGARIEISLAADDRWLHLEVGDNGPGLQGACARRLEEPFHTTRAQGCGLGLAVVRSVAQSHRGQFELADAVGGGARARLSLPLWRPDRERHS